MSRDMPAPFFLPTLYFQFRSGSIAPSSRELKFDIHKLMLICGKGLGITLYLAYFY